MEILGRFKVRNQGAEKVIKAPSESWGEYILEMHEDGSFIYRPSEGQITSSPARYQVWDPNEVYDVVSFKDEKKAIEYKEKMEKQNNRQFRLKKVFNSAGSEKIVEDS